MRDSVRVSVESEYEEESARIHDDSGKVETSDVTFSFSIDGNESVGSDSETQAGASDFESGDGSGGTENEASRPRYIAPLDEVPSDSTLRCEGMNGRRGTEIILHREGEEVFAWRNSCPHKPTIPLDPGGGAIVDEDQLVCHEHGARFECGDGFCSYGPCSGDTLEEFEVEVRDGEVYLTDDRFDAANRLA